MRPPELQEALENAVKRIDLLTLKLLEEEIGYLKILKHIEFEYLTMDEKVGVAQILILLGEKFGEKRSDVNELHSYFEPKFEAESAAGGK